MNESQFKTLTKSEQLNSTLDGIAYWAFVSKPKVSEKYKTTKYTINLCLDEANQRKALAYGLKVKPASKSVPMPFVEITRKVKDGIDAASIKPQLVDSAQHPIKDGTLIGNGSEVRVKFGRYWYEAQGGGVGTSLFKVQVLKMVAFDGSKDNDLISDGSGFIADTASGAADEFDLDTFLDEDNEEAVA